VSSGDSSASSPSVVLGSLSSGVMVEERVYEWFPGEPDKFARLFVRFRQSYSDKEFFLPLGARRSPRSARPLLTGRRHNGHGKDGTVSPSKTDLDGQIDGIGAVERFPSTAFPAV
jgi:hypothetical protein